jgi:hypothetical protein
MPQSTSTKNNSQDSWSSGLGLDQQLSSVCPPAFSARHMFRVVLDCSHMVQFAYEYIFKNKTM